MRDSEPDLDVGDSVPVPIDVERTEIMPRAELSPCTPSLGEPFGHDDDEPPRLPPPPARGSRTYDVPHIGADARERVGAREAYPVVEIRPRARATRTPPVPSRRPQTKTPVDNEAIYQAVLRHFR